MIKNLSMILTVAGASALAVFSMTAPAQAKNGRIPDILKVPEGNVLLLRAHGRGVQKYACPVDATSKAVPHAILLAGDGGGLVSIHFGGPTWEALDGSSVVGDGLNAKHFTAPDQDDIDWLLLPAKSTAGNGPLSRVTFIQRLFTDGGKPPAEGCDQRTIRPRYLLSIPRSTYSTCLRLHSINLQVSVLVKCKSWDLIHRAISDFAVHPTASIIGEADSILARTRAALAPATPVLRIPDRIDPLAKLAAMR